MEKEKRYSYIRKKLARGTVGACILSGLALLLFLLKKGEAGPAVAALALLSVNFSAFSLRLALPVERGEFLEKRWIYGAVGLSVLLLFIWLFFLFLGMRR